MMKLSGSPIDLRPAEHFGCRDRYSFSLYLDIPAAGTSANVLDPVTNLRTLSWEVNWATLIPPVLNQGCKWKVTHHDMTSAVYSAATPYASGWVGISGLPMVQNVCPTATVPSGFVPINTYQTVLGPLTSLSTYYGVLVSLARPFVCGNPAYRGHRRGFELILFTKIN